MGKELKLKQGLAFIKKWIKEQDDSEVHVMAIAGGSASGKGYIVKELLKLDNVQTLEFDRYYYSLKPGQEQENINHDEPAALEISLLVKHLKELKKRNIVEAPVYSFEHAKRIGSDPIKPAKIILLDGLFSFYNQALQNVAELKVYVHADDEVRKERRVKRDVEVRKIPLDVVLEKWDFTVQPMHKKWVHPQKKVADLVIVNN